MNHVTSLITCSASDCDATYKDHHWGHKAAQREGWFIQKDGASWCPSHVPEWVELWRAEQAKRKQT